MSGPSVTSDFTELTVVNDEGTRSVVVRTNEKLALFADDRERVGVGTRKPGAQLEVVSTTGECIRARYESNTFDLALNDNGDLLMNLSADESQINFAKSVNVANHNGSTTGLFLGGALVPVTASELNAIHAITPGTAAANKALVPDADVNISDINTISASQLSGTVVTGDQPNITSVGTLTSLTISGLVSIPNISGTIESASQPNITSVGTLASLNVSGTVTAPTVNTSQVATEGAVEATHLGGTLVTPAQPNITSVGSLTRLKVNHAVIANTLSGRVQTPEQKVITKVGTLSSLSVLGPLIIKDNLRVNGILIAGPDQGLRATYFTNITPGIASISKALLLSETLTIGGIVLASASQLTGSLTTAPQPGITQLGTLSSLTVTNAISANSLMGTLMTNSQNAITQLGTLGSLAVTGSVTALSLTGTLASGPQSAITQIGTINSLTVTNRITCNELTGTLTAMPQPNVTSVGTLDSVTVTNGVTATTLTGTLTSRPQPNITAVGTLPSLVVANGITASQISGTLTSGPQPNITGLGTFNSLSITNGVVANQLGGTLTADSSYSITSVGTLNSLTVINDVTATNMGGTLAAGPQTVITSVGSLSSLAMTGDIQIQSAVDATSPTVGGALTIKGGAGSANNIYVGGNLDVLGSITINGALYSMGTMAGTMATPGTAGTATATTTLVVDASKSVTGVTKITTDNFIMTGSIPTNAGSTWIAPGYMVKKGYTLSLYWIDTYSMFITQDGYDFWMSTDYISWTRKYSGGYNVSAMSDTGRGVDMSASKGTGDNIQWYNYNGTSFTGYTAVGIMQTGNWNDGLWVRELNLFVFIITGMNASASGGYRIATTTNGTSGTWSVTGPTNDSHSFTSICWSPKVGKLVIVTTSSYVLYSSNASTWSSTTTGTDLGGSTSWNSVCWAEGIGLYVAVGNAATMTSPDGINWTARANPVTGTQQWSSVCWSPDIGLLVAVAKSGTGDRVMISSNGINWVARAASPNTADWQKVLWANTLKMFVATSTSNTMVSQSTWPAPSVILSSIAGTSTKSISASDYNLVQRIGTGGSVVYLQDTLTRPDRIAMKLTNDRIGLGTNPLVTLDINGVGIRVRNGKLAGELSINSSGKFTTSGTLGLVTGTQSSVSGGIGIGQTTQANAISVSSTSASTSELTGAVTVAGGVGLPNLASTVVIGGVLKIMDTTESASSSTGCFTSAGGIGIAGALSVGGMLTSLSATASTSTSTGSLISSGGLGVAENINIGSFVNITNGTSASSAITGALITTGGAGIAGDMNISTLVVSNTTTSTSTGTGALTVSGGVGIAGKAYLPSLNVSNLQLSTSSFPWFVTTSNCIITNTTQSTSMTTGALVLSNASGGVGVKKNVFIQGSCNVFNTTDSASVGVGSIVCSGSAYCGSNVISSKDINVVAVASNNLLSNSLNLYSNISNAVADVTKLNTCEYRGSLVMDSELTYLIKFDAATNTLIAANYLFIYKSTDYGTTWVKSPAASPAYMSKSQAIRGLADGTIVGVDYYYASDNALYIRSGTPTTGWATRTAAPAATSTKVAIDIAGASLNNYVVLFNDAGVHKASFYKNGIVAATPSSYAGAPIYAANAFYANGTYLLSIQSYNSAIVYGTNDGTSWGLASTPSSNIRVQSFTYNNVLGLYFAVTWASIWYSSDGKIWAAATAPAAPYPNVANLQTIVCVPNSNIMACYTNSSSTANCMYYTSNGTTWSYQTLTNRITTPDMAYIVPADTNAMYAYLHTNTTPNTGNILGKIGPFATPASFNRSVASSGKIDLTSNTGHKWYTGSTKSATGTLAATLSSTAFTTPYILSTTNTNAATSSTTGSLIVSGGVGIAKSLYVGGDGNFAGTVTQASDLRLKKDVSPISVTQVKSLYDTDVVTYKWKHGDQSEQVGVIAQDLVKHGLGNLIREVDNDEMEEGEDATLSPAKKQLSVSYAGIASYNMRMLQVLVEKNKSLRDLINATTARMKSHDRGL